MFSLIVTCRKLVYDRVDTYPINDKRWSTHQSAFVLVPWKMKVHNKENGDNEAGFFFF